MHILTRYLTKPGLKILTVVLTALVVQGLFVPVARSQVKLAQTGFEFLDVATDARATGMGGAFTTINGTSESLLYNPAGIATIPSFVDLGASQLNWIADIKYLSGTIAFAPYGGRYGVVGLDFVNVDYGQFNFTEVANNEQGYTDLTGYPKPYAYAVGLGYAKQLSEQFSVGGEVKYADQNLGNSLVPVYNQVVVNNVLTTDTSYVTKNYDLGVLAFSFGTIYKTGLKSLTFGMSISNFSREIAYEEESFELPLTFRFGISMNLVDLVPSLKNLNSFVVSIDAVHPRSYAEYLNIGGEYTFMNMLALRAGYATKQSDYGFSLGIGVHKFGISIDYSYTPHRIFSDIHRISVRFAI